MQIKTLYIDHLIAWQLICKTKWEPKLDQNLHSVTDIAGQDVVTSFGAFLLLRFIEVSYYVADMTAKIILSSEPGSAKFTDKVILFDRQEEEVRVTRSSTDETSDTQNAVFDCQVTLFRVCLCSDSKMQVLSKNHALLIVDNGQFYMKDQGSRNGSFINNFRLDQEKKGFKIFSQDILR